jgi:hypothetical protein
VDQEFAFGAKKANFKIFALKLRLAHFFGYWLFVGVLFS